MITIYQRSSCSSSKKPCNGLILIDLPMKMKIDFLSRTQLITILSLTENELEDIIKGHGDSKTRSKVKKLTTMILNEVLFYIQTHSEILRTPVIISQKKLLVGFNSEDIHQFILQSNRTTMNT